MTPSAPVEPAVIRYVLNFDRLYELFDRLTAALVPSQQFYNHFGQLVCVKPGIGVEVVGIHNLNGLISPWVEIEMLAMERERTVRRGFRLMPADYAKAYLQSPTVIEKFPPLNHYTRSPLFDRDWNLIATPGYDPGPGIYYDGPQIDLTPGTATLDRVTREFCWQTPIDRVNYIAGLITGVTIQHWPGTHPLQVFNANVQGAGKSTAARVQALILHGSCHSITFTPNDEELEKQMATRVAAGDRTVLIDNAKHTGRVLEIASAVLERSITDPILNFRRLGTNAAIRRPNDVIFSLTMNDAKLGPDLRRRSIPINFELRGEARDRRFSIDNLDQFVLAHRNELLGEILGLVERWKRAGYPIPDQPARHSIGQGWAVTIDAILRYAGYLGFLGNLAASTRAYDPDFDAVSEVCAVCHGEAPKTASEWATQLVRVGLLADRLCDAMGFEKPDRPKATIVGRLFGKCLGSTFEVGAERFTLMGTDKGKAHVSTRYWFEKVAAEVGETTVETDRSVN